MKRSYALCIFFLMGVFSVLLFPENIKITQVGEWGTGNYEDVFVQGNYAYLADYHNGLYIIDVSNPESPLLVGNYYSEEKGGKITREIYVRDNYAYLANEKFMFIVNVSDPTSPTLAGKYDTLSFAWGIFVKGNYAYVADQLGGLVIIDVSNPTSPVLTGSYSTSRYAQSVYVSDNYAYVTENLVTEGGKLLIIDVSDPVSPKLVGTYNTPREAYKVFVRDNYAYVADGYGGLQILDISNPTSPTLAGSYITYGVALDVYVKGNYAYVADVFDLKIINISDPVSPTLAVTYYTPGNMRGAYADDNYVYAVEGEGMSGKFLILEMYELYTLTVLSSPFKGVPIEVSTFDNSFNKNGNTNFHRIYDPGTKVRLTAPAIFSGSIFTKWIVNGVDNSNPSIEITMDNNYAVTVEYQILTFPYISLNRTYMNFGAEKFGSSPPPQTFLIDNLGGGSLDWYVTLDQNWLHCTPSSGNGAGSVSVSINPANLSAGSYSGTIKVHDPNATNSPQSIDVTLRVYNTGENTVPFGEFATPINGATVSGSIAVTGWVLDDIGVENVKLYRGEVGKLTYIGDGIFVEGARPDVELAYPGYPMNYKAGWGYMMLTNFLPGGGNGEFKIHAVVTDAEGNQITLGTKTIHCDNAHAVKPFGAIDTPTQGGTASGKNFINWGWVLTPLPNKIPEDGSTINIWVDGKNIGHPTYNNYREDIAALFPGYMNSNGAIGYFYLDTSVYENGIHTIQWTATDSAGNTDGIGSRYFSILNSGESSSNSQSAVKYPYQNDYNNILNFSIEDIPMSNIEPLRVEKGIDEKAHCIKPDETGIYSIEIEELERLEVTISDSSPVAAGFMMVGAQLKPLPVGTTLCEDTGKFYWTPGPGFVGNYHFLFIERDHNNYLSRKELIVDIMPKSTIIRH